METVLAILFADVCDSTRLYETAGNIRATEIIQGALRRLEGAVLGQGGRVVKSLGDGLMCVFPHAAAACDAAEDMLAEVADSTVLLPGVVSPEVRVRIGVHFGSVIDSGADVFGDAINVAARVQSMASPGEILLTEDAVAGLPMSGGGRAQLVDTTMVKGKSVPIRIYRLRHDRIAEDGGDSTVIASGVLDKIRKATQTLTLTYLDQRIVVCTERPKVIIGRHEKCDIAIQSRLASRQHGAIELSRESFMLTDHSSNGTFIRTGALPPVALRRDTSKLIGRGLIGIGAVPERIGEEHVVGFQCEVSV